MFHADTAGLYNVLRAIRRYAQGYQGQVWEPSDLLVRLAQEGGTFNYPQAARPIPEDPVQRIN
jgi:3-hydroxyacyl-CoA dehydrogenase